MFAVLFFFSIGFFFRIRTHFHRVNCRFLQDADVIKPLELQLDGQTVAGSAVFMKIAKFARKLRNLRSKNEQQILKG